MKKFIIAVFVVLGISGCSFLQEALDWIRDQNPPIVTPGPTPSPEPTPGATATPAATKVPTAKPTAAPTSLPSTENPNVNGQIQYFADGSGGNLWKPVSDTTGNLVLVFSSKWKKEFSGGCTLEKKDGKTENLYCGGPFKCYGNPDAGGERLHMRSNIKCSQAKEVKATCKEQKQTVVFSLKDASKLSKVCERHD